MGHFSVSSNFMKLSLSVFCQKLIHTRPVLWLTLVGCAGGLLTGCEQVKQFKERILHPAGSASGVASTPMASGNPSPNPPTINNRPIVYPFATWQQQPASSVALGDRQGLVQWLGGRLPNNALLATPTQDPKSLDIMGNIATRYQFAKPTLPYFNLIDSKKFVELHWYYGSASDFDHEKQLAVSYAEQVYQLARGWLGEQSGANLVEDILAGKTVTNQQFSVQPIKVKSIQKPVGKNSAKTVTVMLASCDNFSCHLVLKKP